MGGSGRNWLRHEEAQPALLPLLRGEVSVGSHFPPLDLSSLQWNQGNLRLPLTVFENPTQDRKVIVNCEGLTRYRDC